MAERLYAEALELGCYIASLAVVLRFMETYLLDILRALTHFF